MVFVTVTHLVCHYFVVRFRKGRILILKLVNVEFIVMFLLSLIQ